MSWSRKQELIKIKIRNSVEIPHYFFIEPSELENLLNKRTRKIEPSIPPRHSKDHWRKEGKVTLTKNENNIKLTHMNKIYLISVNDVYAILTHKIPYAKVKTLE